MYLPTDRYVYEVETKIPLLLQKIVAAFRGMHVSPAKHSFGKCDRQTDRQTDRQMDDGQSDPYVSICFAGDTKRALKSFGHEINMEEIDESLLLHVTL